MITRQLFETKILIKNGLLKEFPKELLSQRTIIIADHAIKDLYGTSLAAQIDAELLTIPTGEQSKSQTTANDLLEQLFKMQAHRKTTLIAVGGGVTIDLVGFVASIYLRGVPLILIPTSLVAIVDASIGGKTAIDTPFGKNLLGSFYHPKAIITDPSTLATLPEKEWINGLAEILKMALIHDASIWEQKNKKTFSVILQAMQGKIAIVEKDPYDWGLRHILNFGHTIGHALEALSHYTLPHGEAVAIGTVAESYLSMDLGYLQRDMFEKILAAYQFPLQLPKHYSREKILQAMIHDKKRNQVNRFVLIDKIGHAIPFEGAYCRTVTTQELAPTLHWMEANYG